MDIKEITLPVDGMTCAACSRAVERALGRLDGVEAASVNIATNRAVISFDSEKLRVADLKLAVVKAGYAPRDPEQNRDLEMDRKKLQDKSGRIQREFTICAVFAAVLLYISMGHMVSLPLPAFLDPAYHPQWFALAQLVLTLPILIAGRSFFVVGIKTAAHLNPNMDTLVAMGCTAAFGYSLYATVKIFMGDMHAYHELYFESAGVIITFVLLGRMLESRSKFKTSQAVYRLMELAPKTALLEKDGAQVEIDASEVRPGDLILVKPGMAIAVDGEIVDGTTTVDESMLTGESIPVEKKAGDTVFSGTINGGGLIHVRATKTSEETTLSQIIRLMEDAQNTKAPIARLADVISGWFVPAVLVIAVIATVAWLLAGKDIAFALTIFVSILVIACPCALGLATPTAIMAGTGKGAENGILIKSGEALEIAHHVNAVVFDKTGTLTNGAPVVTDILPATGISKEDVLRYSACAETGSEHPLGRAMIEKAREAKLELPPYEKFEALQGRGIRAQINQKDVLLGNQLLMEENGVDIASALQEHARLAAEGKTAMYLAIDGGFAGLIAAADTVRETSREAVAQLNHMGIDVIMLTGDSQITAKAIAGQIGIARVFAGVLPQGKADVIRQLKDEGKTVAMVGDGINDAPALTLADVGVAVGTGTDIAIDSASVVLMQEDMRLVPRAFRLSRRTIRIIRQNLFWAFAYNTCAIPIAAGIATLFGGPLLSPMLAAAAMSLSSVTVVLNSLRLRGIRLK